MCWEVISWEVISSAVAVVSAMLALIVSGRMLCTMTKQLKLQNYIEYTKRYQEIILNFPENVNERSFDMEKLDKAVQDKTMRYMRAYYDLCFEEFDLQSKGFIHGKMWDTWKAGMEFAFSKSAFRQAWAKIKQDTKYDEGFNKLVDGCHENGNKDIS